MSERRDSTCQKHDIPKSLQGTEDADFIWNMITERFPNAAPLLCEMEAVIDRAEDLLQQLRTPYRRDLDSNESSFLIPTEESLPVEIDKVEDKVVSKSIAETQISEDSIYEKEIELNSPSHTECLIKRDQEDLDRSSDSSLQYSTAETATNFEDSASSKFEAHSPQAAKEVNSLEEWEKAIDNAIRESTSKTGSLNHFDDGEVFHPGETYATSVLQKREADSNNDCEELNVDLHEERDTDVGDSVIDSDYNQSIKSRELEEINNDARDILLQGSGDKTSARFTGSRTPLSILEDYAKRCKVPVTYQYITDGPHRHKTNVYVIRGNLGGFAATSRGESEDSTKNSAATKILLMIADQQMNDEKLITLMDLQREEMLEIIDLDVDNTRETAQRKLYKLCLEKDEALPKYFIDKIKTYQGFMYTATCTALGYTGEGRGVRECVAKKAAADELYRQYCQNVDSKLQVEMF